MAIKSANTSDPPAKRQPLLPQRLDRLLEEEGVIATLRQRITNLESFRELYLQLESQTQTNPQPTHDHTKKITALERELKETNSCVALLESELERLMAENETLKTSTQTLGTTIDPNSAISMANNQFGNEPLEPEETIQSLRLEVEQAMDMAFGAMRSNADLGGVIHLLTQSFECSSTTELSNLVLETVSNYNLNCVVAFSNSGKKEYFSTHPPVTPAQTNLINQIPTNSIVTETKTELMFYTSHVQLLITGFNSSDFKAFNDLKDTLSMLATGLNAGTRRVLSELIATKERANFTRLVSITQHNIKGIDVKQNKDIAEVDALTKKLMSNLKLQLAKSPGDQAIKERIIAEISEDLVKVVKVVKEASFNVTNFKKIIEALSNSLTK